VSAAVEVTSGEDTSVVVRVGAMAPLPAATPAAPGALNPEPAGDEAAGGQHGLTSRLGTGHGE
jgi:hypothetical protein